MTIAAARVLRCRRAREHYPCMTTGSAAEGAGDAPLASPGARWTGEEDEELVAAVRAGADLAVIAEAAARSYAWGRRRSERLSARVSGTGVGGWPASLNEHEHGPFGFKGPVYRTDGGTPAAWYSG